MRSKYRRKALEIRITCKLFQLYASDGYAYMVVALIVLGLVCTACAILLPVIHFFKSIMGV